MYELIVEDSFDAAHCLRGYMGKCEHLHGHTYKVQALLRVNKLNETGLSVDFREVKAALKNAVDAFDHKHLNEMPEFSEINPSAENIAKTIFGILRRDLGGCVHKVIVWETPTSAAGYFEDAEN